jgi:hypothetical protein
MLRKMPTTEQIETMIQDLQDNATPDPYAPPRRDAAAHVLSCEVAIAELKAREPNALARLADTLAEEKRRAKPLNARQRKYIADNE